MLRRKGPEHDLGALFTSRETVGTESERINHTIDDLKEVITTMENYLKMKEFCENEGVEVKFEGVVPSSEIAYPGSLGGEGSDTHGIKKLYSMKTEKMLEHLTPEQKEKMESQE